MKMFGDKFAGGAAGSGVVGTAAVLALFGCASPAPPRAPSLHLPEVADALRAERRGPEVMLQFTTPVRSTDGFALTAPVTASVCRAVGEGPCTVTGRRTVAGRVEWVDTLPPALATGPPRRLAYRVELFNPSDKSAGPSDAVLAAAGEAPHPVEALSGEGSRAGITLRWQAQQTAPDSVLLERTSLSGPPAPKPGKIALPAKGLPGKKAKLPSATPTTKTPGGETVWLRADAASAATDRGGTVDASAAADTTYRYRVQRIRTVTVEGSTLEMRSAFSAPVEFTLRDVYPPAVPQGLAAAAFPVEGSAAISVDLIWQPNTETDLAGYTVYRQTLDANGAATGTAMKLNAAPVMLPAFHDTAASHAMRYRYTVVAVDAKGNASAASSPADLSTAP